MITLCLTEYEKNTKAIRMKVSDAQAVAAHVTSGDITMSKFSDGELSPEIIPSVDGRDVLIYGSTHNSDKILELCLIANAAKQHGAKEVVAFIPYFGYSRQDKRNSNKQNALGAKVMANNFEANGVTKIYSLEMHSAQLELMGGIPIINKSVDVAGAIKETQSGATLRKQLCVCSTDMGGSKRVEIVADQLAAAIGDGVDMSTAFISKNRKVANQVDKMFLVGDVSGRVVFLVDDICDTAGTIAKATALIMDHGAEEVHCYCVHPVLSGNAIKVLNESKLKTIVFFDTVSTAKNKLRDLTMQNHLLPIDAYYQDVVSTLDNK